MDMCDNIFYIVSVAPAYQPCVLGNPVRFTYDPRFKTGPSIASLGYGLFAYYIAQAFGYDKTTHAPGPGITTAADIAQLFGNIYSVFGNFPPAYTYPLCSIVIENARDVQLAGIYNWGLSDLLIINSTITVEDFSLLMPLDITYPVNPTNFIKQTTKIAIQDSTIDATSPGGLISTLQIITNAFLSPAPYLDTIWASNIVVNNSAISKTQFFVLNGDFDLIGTTPPGI